MQVRLSLGNAAPVEVATARTNLAAAETDRAAQGEQCAREINALAALSGVGAAEIRAALPQAGESEPWVSGVGVSIADVIPEAPPIRPVLPAVVLLSHPGVAAAEREMQARWAEIDVARADRLPRIDLAAVLTGQWIDAMGEATNFTTWSVGPQLSGVLFDGGAGAASVRNADARYREAVATLEGEVRAAIQGVEDGLAAAHSADERFATSLEAVDAARLALEANEARWRVGAGTQFEREESRRLYSRAQESLIAAARDRSLAWIELVRASGNSFDIGGAPMAAGRSHSTLIVQ